MTSLMTPGGSSSPFVSFADLLRVLRLDVEDVLFTLGGELLELLLDLAVAAVELDLVPVAVRDLVEHLERDLLALRQEDLALVVDEARRRRSCRRAARASCCSRPPR